MSGKDCCVLIILDGWGNGYPWGGNALAVASTPNFNLWWKTYPHTELCASGTCVGLPGHEMGNSEVGHISLGAGRVVHQDRLIIDGQIKSGKFFTNPVLTAAIKKADSQSRLHLIGLVSTGGIHSAFNHIEALEKLISQIGLKDHYFHVFTDGRDSDPMSGLVFVSQLERISSQSGGKIATVSGRYYAMDRDNRWERTRAAYEAIALAKGPKADGAKAAISASYRHGVTDEYLLPTVVDPDYKGIEPGDILIFFNFRQDRIRQIVTALLAENCHQVGRSQAPPKVNAISFVPYGIDVCLKVDAKSAFKPQLVANGLSEVISKNGFKQMHIAESEKYAHVTYFFNGGREEPFTGEERKLIPSPQVATYNLKPEMSAPEITDSVIHSIKSRRFRFIVANFANPDMVGHTGDFRAAVAAVEVIDELLGKIKSAVDKYNAYLIVTADHGNAEEMVDIQTGRPNPEHTRNPVPFILVNSTLLPSRQLVPIENPKLANVAPTILDLLGISKPPEMTAESLVRPG